MKIREVMANRFFKGKETKDNVKQSDHGCVNSRLGSHVPCPETCEECYDKDMKETRK